MADVGLNVKLSKLLSRRNLAGLLPVLSQAISHVRIFLKKNNNKTLFVYSSINHYFYPPLFVYSFINLTIIPPLSPPLSPSSAAVETEPGVSTS